MCWDCAQAKKWICGWTVRAVWWLSLSQTSTAHAVFSNPLPVWMCPIFPMTLKALTGRVAARPFPMPIGSVRAGEPLPGIVVYEVSRRLLHLYGEAGQAQGLRYLRLAQYVAADWDIHLAASHAAARYKLHMADAIIWQTAQSHAALLYTQDVAFASVPGVVYQAKP